MFHGPDAAGVAVTTSQTGLVRATADWYSSGNNVELYLVDDSCRANPLLPGPPSCVPIYARAEGAVIKPEVMAACVDAGAYVVLVINRGPAGDNVGVRIDVR